MLGTFIILNRQALETQVSIDRVSNCIVITRGGRGRPRVYHIAGNFRGGKKFVQQENGDFVSINFIACTAFHELQ